MRSKMCREQLLRMRMLRIVDEYLVEKINNNLIYGLKSIKQSEIHNENQISIQTFSKPNIQLFQSQVSLGHNEKSLQKAESRQKANENEVEKSIKMKSIKNSFVSENEQTVTDDFEDVILQKLSYLEKDIQKLKLNRTFSSSLKSQSTLQGDMARQISNIYSKKSIDSRCLKKRMKVKDERRILQNQIEMQNFQPITRNPYNNNKILISREDSIKDIIKIEQSEENQYFEEMERSTNSIYNQSTKNINRLKNKNIFQQNSNLRKYGSFNFRKVR